MSSTEWTRALQKYDACVGIFEVFRSDRNEYIFRVNGFHPAGPSETVSLCRFDAVLPRWLVVESPASLGSAHGQTMKILYNDQLTEWIRVDSADKVWIRTDGPNPLSPDSDYEVLRQPDETLIFRPMQKRRR